MAKRKKNKRSTRKPIPDTRPRDLSPTPETRSKLKGDVITSMRLCEMGERAVLGIREAHRLMAGAISMRWSEYTDGMRGSSSGIDINAYSYEDYRADVVAAYSRWEQALKHAGIRKWLVEASVVDGIPLRQIACAVCRGDRAMAEMVRNALAIYCEIRGWPRPRAGGESEREAA